MEILTVKGKVVEGTGDGRKMNVPTANIAVDPTIFKDLPLGVFASVIEIDKKLYKSITHIGPRAIFKEEEVQFEVHIFDFSNSIYGEEVEVRLIDFIRETKKFDSVDAMMEQIREDIKKAKEYLQTFVC